MQPGKKESAKMSALISTSARSYQNKQKMPSHKSMNRYRRSSLPIANGSSAGISDIVNLSTLASYRQPIHNKDNDDIDNITDIYFDRHKKSKFMKHIVDGYFEDGQNEHELKQMNKIRYNIHNIVKNKHNNISCNVSLERESSDSSKKKMILQRKQLRKSFQAYQKTLPLVNTGDKSESSTKISFVKNHTFSVQVPINQQPDQNLSVTLHPNINLNSSSNLQYLPPIEQQNEGNSLFFDTETDNPSNEIGRSANSFWKASDLHSTTIEPFELESQNNTRIQLYQNQVFRLHIMQRNGKPLYRLKQFKSFGAQIMKRQERAKKLGVTYLWQQSKISSNCFVSKLVHPLKNLICKILPNLESSNNLSNKGVNSSTLCKFKVKTTNYRNYLLQNNCLQLKHLIRQICYDMKKVENRVLNNKINPSNIFVMKGNKIVIGQWGYSSFRDSYNIQKKQFESRVHPILKTTSQWFTTPQYLAPEILLAVSAKKEQDEPDIWINGAASDIWSLGLTIFQILTMIPLWINESCMIRYNSSQKMGSTFYQTPNINLSASTNSSAFSSNNSIQAIPQNNNLSLKPRKGLLATDDRNLQKILTKQTQLQKNLRKYLDSEIEESIDPQILEILYSTLRFQASERVNLDQIIRRIK